MSCTDGRLDVERCRTVDKWRYHTVRKKGTVPYDWESLAYSYQVKLYGVKLGALIYEAVQVSEMAVRDIEVGHTVVNDVRTGVRKARWA